MSIRRAASLLISMSNALDNCSAIFRQPKRGVASFHLDDRVDEFSLRDLWVQGASAFSGCRAGDTCASPGRDGSTARRKASVSEPSCSGVWVNIKNVQTPSASRSHEVRYG